MGGSSGGGFRGFFFCFFFCYGLRGRGCFVFATAVDFRVVGKNVMR